MNQVGQIVNDGLKQVLAARVRIQQYAADLTQVQVDLSTENARHTQGMLTLGRLEAARWQLTGELLAQYSVIYDPATWLGAEINLPETWDAPDPKDHPITQTYRIRLFPD